MWTIAQTWQGIKDSIWNYLLDQPNIFSLSWLISWSIKCQMKDILCNWVTSDQQSKTQRASVYWDIYIIRKSASFWGTGTREWSVVLFDKWLISYKNGHSDLLHQHTRLLFSLFTWNGGNQWVVRETFGILNHWWRNTVDKVQTVNVQLSKYFCHMFRIRFIWTNKCVCSHSNQIVWKSDSSAVCTECTLWYQYVVLMWDTYRNLSTRFSVSVLCQYQYCVYYSH